MIPDFETFCLYTYVLVDDMLHAWAAHLGRTGPPPLCSDSELLTMVLVGEACGWDIETEMVRHWHAYPQLFPHVPEQSRFNRRRRNLALTLNLVRQELVRRLDLAADPACVIDSLPVPAVGFHLAPTASADWAAAGATYGHVASKKQMIFGYRLHLLVTLNGLILDFILAPAHATDLAVGVELLSAHTDLLVLGDKGYISQPVAETLRTCNRIALYAMRRQNQKTQWPSAFTHLVTHCRHIIETVNGQLVQQFRIQKNQAHTCWGLCTRLYAKLTAHTLGIYLNRLTGYPHCLQIKHWAFN